MAEKEEVKVPSEVPWTQPNGIYATYDLHCHCGTIKYKMKLSPPLYVEQTEGKEQCQPVECDCSWCERLGLWNAHPLAKDVEFTQGLADRKEYRFGSKTLPLWFCSHCGSVIGTDLTTMMEALNMEHRYCINLRMLKDFDRKKLNVRQVNFMKEYGPKYEV